jgi:hypothetical protein
VKKTLIAILGAILVIGIAAPVGAADLPDEQLTIPRPPVENTGGYSGAYYDDQRTLFRAFTYLEAWKSTNFADRDPSTCKSIFDSPCSESDLLFIETPISPCSAELTRDCVVTLAGKKGEGDWSEATLVETLTSKIDAPTQSGLNRFNTPFIGDPSRGIPSSGAISLWKIPGMPHAQGDEYLLIPKLNVEFQSRNGGKPFNLDVGIFPVSRTSSEGKFEQDCFLLTTKYCLTRWAHVDDSSYKVSLKTTAKVIGWFHGRIYEPTVSSEKLSDKQTLLTVEGKSMRVPTLAAWSKNTDLPKTLNDMIEQEFRDRGNNFAGTAFFGGNEKSRDLQTVVDERNPSFTENQFARYLLWVEVAKDKAYANPSTWSFRTMDSYGQFERCIGDSGVAGMVTTNSNAYLAGPPAFADGFLSYRVSSPHYDSKGQVQVGTYDLAIRSDIARCIYGFSSAPIQASISVISDDGEAKTATTVVTERANWLRLSAKGFTFSSPTVKVALSQAGSSSGVAKKSTITCVKGKTSKKVTAVKPKCPTGYKKKA